MSNTGDKKIKKLAPLFLSIGFALLPIAIPAIATPATSQSEYKAQVAAATQNVADIQAKLDAAQAQLQNLILVQNASQANFDSSKKAMQDADIALQKAKTDHTSQSLVVSNAEAAVATAQADLNAKQQAYDIATQNVNNQTTLVQSYQTALVDAQIQATIASNNLLLAQNQLKIANQDYLMAEFNYNNAVADQKIASDNYAQAVVAVQMAGAKVDATTSSYNLALQVLQDKTILFNAADSNFNFFLTEYNMLAQATNDQKALVDNAQGLLSIATTKMQNSLVDLNNAQDLVTSLEPSLATALSEMNTAQTNLNIAQYNYDNNLIAIYPTNTPPPVAGLKVEIYNNLNQIPPQRSTTTYHLCKTMTMSQINANWGGGNIEGCNGDRVMIHYSGYITYPTNARVQFMAQADDGFYMTINGTPIVTDWFDKGCGASSFNYFTFQANVSYPIDAWFYENGGGACSTLYGYDTAYYPYGWFVIPASMFTQTDAAQPIYEKDPALLVILQNAQIAYEQKLSIYNNINISYQNAVAALAGYQLAYDNDVANYNQLLNEYNIQLNNLASVTQQRDEANSNLISAGIDLDFATQEKTIAQQDVDISNADMVLALNDYAIKMNDYSIAQNSLAIANQNLQDKLNAFNIASSNLVIAQQTESQDNIINVQKQQLLSDATILTTEQKALLSIAQADQNTALINLNLSKQALDAINKILDAEKQLLLTLANLILQRQSEYDLAVGVYNKNTVQLNTDINNVDNATISVENYKQELQAAKDSLNAIPLPAIPDPTPTPIATPDPTLTPDPVITPDPMPTLDPTPIPVTPDVTLNNLESINPQELTTSQVEELKLAANEVLATTAEGSSEYNKALNALFVAAQADDIQVPEELANIPGIGQAAVAAIAAINFMGNVGADMAPATREKAKKEIVAAVVATGAAVSAATGATTTAASTGSTGGSGGSSSGSSGDGEGAETNKPNRRETR